MKGDFSKWDSDAQRNFTGTLQQQGRVLLDEDWNAQSRITSEWQDAAARDTIGPGVAAVPAETPNAFRVTQARADDQEVMVELTSGRVWADGLLTYLDSDTELTATYLASPIYDPEILLPPEPGHRDAVILEVWRDTVSGFQLPETLIEPALGGPDTTERIHTSMAVRLLRLADEENCQNIADRLNSDRDNRGNLRVTLQPTTTMGEECPVADAGGYTGFEHNLYRIEIAQVNNDELEGDFFKWSQFNGGLVGRGICDLGGAEPRISIIANAQAILTSGLTNLYLEVLEPDPDTSVPEGICHWRVTYGARVELDVESNDLVIVEPFYSVEDPQSEVEVFFRLWNAIEAVTDPLVETPVRELQDGILLEFDTAAGQVYHPGDYWTFDVRANNHNNSILLDSEPPEGIRYHRVPLAELTWPDDLELNESGINDCRRVFRPLTRQNICCTVTVGDGVSTHGDFDSIQQAVEYLRPEGGEICVLPGTHLAEVSIEGFHGKFLRIKGCGLHSAVIGATANPVFRILSSSNISIENMELSSGSGTVIEVVENSSNIEISCNHIFACIHGINVRESVEVWIHHNKIRMLDRSEGRAAIYFGGEQGLIERNDIAAFPRGLVLSPPTNVPSYTDLADEECDEWGDRLQDTQYVRWFHWFLEYLWGFNIYIWYAQSGSAHTYRAQGGIQISSGSEVVKIVENVIVGGAGNGITLGSEFSAIMPGETIDTMATPNAVNIHEDNVLIAIRAENGDGMPGALYSLYHRGEAESIVSSSVNDQGSGSFKVEIFGEYDLVLPGFDANSIVVDDGDITSEFFQYIRVTVTTTDAEQPVAGSDESAWIYEILIEQNEIQGMGLSGIGVPELSMDIDTTPMNEVPISRVYFPDVSNQTFPNISFVPIVDLTVSGNRIHHCLQQPPVTEPGRRTGVLGVGGVSLGSCFNLVIRDNRIEDNGLDFLHPVCGIFVWRAAQIDISANKIVNNGQINEEAIYWDIETGIRGGIVLFAVSDPFPEPMLSTYTGHRVHGNVVTQPAGPALYLVARGALSVSDNIFHVVRSECQMFPGYARQFNETAGVVFIRNLGQPRLNTQTTFADNQAKLYWNLNCNVAQYIDCMDRDSDLLFSNNQSDVLHDLESSLEINTSVSAGTLRAIGNRLVEPPDEAESLDSLRATAEYMINVSDNQVDHCINANVSGNKIHLDGNWSRFFDDPDCDSGSSSYGGGYYYRGNPYDGYYYGGYSYATPY